MRLPLKTRVATVREPPVEICAGSIVNGAYYDDDRALRYIYLPVSEVKQRGINLLHGYDNFDNADLCKAPDLGASQLMESIKCYEKKTKKKLTASLICWRGLVTNLLLSGMLRTCMENAAVQIVKFDGSYFMCTNHKYPKVERDFKDKDKFDYAGHHFEDVASLAKPFGRSTREEIVERYTSTYKPGPEYSVLTKQKIGDHVVILGAEVDGASQAKDPKNPMSNYYELKTSAAIRDERQTATFEKKLAKFYIQSALAGVPRIMIGYRDRAFKLRSVETFKTADLPGFVAKSKLLLPEERWVPQDAWDFFEVFLQMLEDVITEEGVTFDLLFAEGADYLRLVEATNPRVPDEPGSISFLPKSFVDWRRELANMHEEIQVKQ